MYRTHNCGELRLTDLNKEVRLAGWMARSRDFGGLTFIDMRDRFGITQLVFDMEENPGLCESARQLGREYVIQVNGRVKERSNKNPKIPTGDIEIQVDELLILNPSITPPFTIEDESDGGDDLRMKFRYLDLRRNMVRENLLFRHKLARQIRNYLDQKNFIEVETPVLIKSTPEGARDFIVPSRMNPGEFYALPQSPQTFKQILMVAGFDRYYQIVKCFRDEDLRADRQPEFTQIDCELSFVSQDEILDIFEGLIKNIFLAEKNIQLQQFPRMPYEVAMEKFGTDKPDLRFGMEIIDLTDISKQSGFPVFEQAEYIAGIAVTGASEYSRKQIDELTEWVKRPQIGAAGLIYIRCNMAGDFKSSVDKFFDQERLRHIFNRCKANLGDLILIMAGALEKTRKALGSLRLELGERMGLRNKNVYTPLWVTDFPLLEWNEESGRWHAMHHPFTAPLQEYVDNISDNPGKAKASAYDLVINGVEIGGGSIRIFDRKLQQKMFSLLGFSEEEAKAQFGFLLNAFEYGAPPHGGIALGFDRLCAVLGGSDSIRDYIAFPKNNAGRDMMIDAPSPVSKEQLKELGIKTG